MTVALLFSHDFVRSFCTDRGFVNSVARWIPPGLDNGDLLSILSHIVASLRMELLLTQMFTPLKAPR